MRLFSRKPPAPPSAESNKPADVARREFLKRVGAVAVVGAEQLLPALYDRRALLASPGWKALDRATQSRLSRLLDTESPLRTRAQRYLVQLMAGADWAKGDAARQSALLRALPRSDRVIPGYSYELLPEPSVTGQLKGRPQGPFPSNVDDARGARFAAEAFLTSVNGRDISLYFSPVGTTAGLVNFELPEAQQALVRVEARARRQLTKIIFAPTASPADVARLRKGETPAELRFVEVNEKGEAIVWATPAPRRSVTELVRALSHEGIHPAALRLFGGDPQKSAAWEEWRSACKSDGVFFSRYARDNWEKKPAEDFAETVALAFAVGLDSIRAVSPERARLLEPILGQMYARFGVPEAPIHA